jgi:hypothetical protein
MRKGPQGQKRSIEVFKTLLFFEGYDEGHSYLIDTIFYQGAWWLVASWIAQYATSERAPERLVRLTGLRFEEVEGKPHRFLLHNSIPRSVLDGQAQDGYVLATNQVFDDSPDPNAKKPH